MRKVEQIEADLETMLADLKLLDYNDHAFEDTLAAVVGLKKELDAVRTRIEDLNAAKYLLNKHGYAFKIFTPEDVERRLLESEAYDHAGRDIAKIVAHVVEGDDWQTMSEELPEEDANIWAIIEGTKGDHPEWFGNAGTGR